MIEDTLRQLENWYNEPSQGGDRPKLLSKLAVLELSGWIEGEIDRLAYHVDKICLNDPRWVTANIIARSHGFDYLNHWRIMLTRLVGEVFARRIEGWLEENFPGDLELLKSMLGTLWNIRCDFAHADIISNVITQQRFNAPSWVINQHRVIKRLMERYERAIAVVLNDVSLPNAADDPA